MLTTKWNSLGCPGSVDPALSAGGPEELEPPVAGVPGHAADPDGLGVDVDGAVGGGARKAAAAPN